MYAKARQALSLIAILAAGAVLLADSTEPVCGMYAPFVVQLEYVTDCGDGGEGTITVVYAGQHGTAGRPEINSGLLNMDITGPLDLTLAYLDFDSGECLDDGEGIGTLTELGFRVDAGLDSGDQYLNCEAWDSVNLTQKVQCGASETEVCTIDFAIRS